MTTTYTVQVQTSIIMRRDLGTCAVCLADEVNIYALEGRIMPTKAPFIVLGCAGCIQATNEAIHGEG